MHSPSTTGDRKADLDTDCSKNHSPKQKDKTMFIHVLHSALFEKPRQKQNQNEMYVVLSIAIFIFCKKMQLLFGIFCLCSTFLFSKKTEK